MDYGDIILRILYEAGTEGLPVQKIALHVHAACNSLFSPVDYLAVRNWVQGWLQKNARMPNSFVCHGQKRGFYCFDVSSGKAQQLMLEFDEDDVVNENAKAEGNSCEDAQLSLFD